MLRYLLQVVYSVTEMIAAVTNYRMLDLRRPPNRPGLIMMAVVGSAHTVQSLADEALVNIFTLRGTVHCICVLVAWGCMAGCGADCGAA